MGVLPRIWRDPLRFFSEVARECGGLARVGLGKFTLYLLSDPDAIQEVLLDDGARFWKGAGLAAAETVMGKGLATSEGELWRRQRRLMQPSFQPRRLEGLLQVAEDTVEELLRDWEPHLASGRAFDLAPDMNRLSQQAIFRTMFGADVAPEESARLGAAVAEANAFINHAAWRLIPLPDAWPTPRNLRFKRALRTLDDAIYRLLAARRAAAEPGDDLLGRLVGARDPETGEGMNDRQIRDEVMTLFVAGHETTSNALSWTFHLLARHPEVAAQLAAGTSADLPGRVVQESLRFYPPSWVIVRTPYRPETLAGYAVPEAAPLLISQWVVHRRPDLWEAPERFDPDRWLPERAANRHRFAYFPYGGGRRTCIGNHFATRLLELAVTTICPRVTLEPAGPPPTPQPSTTLRPKGGVPVVARAR